MNMVGYLSPQFHDYISYLPDEILSIILNMVSVGDILNFLITAKKNLRDVGLRIYLIKNISAKVGIHNEELYYRSLAEVRNVYNVLVKPGHLYEISRPGSIIFFPQNTIPIIPGEFVKLYSDGRGSGVALTSDGRAYLYGTILLLLNEESNRGVRYKIIQPPEGEKYIDACMDYDYSCRRSMCILLTNKGKCHGIGHNANKILGLTAASIFTTPKEVLLMPDNCEIKQVKVYVYNGLILTKSNEVFSVGLGHMDLVGGVPAVVRFHHSPVKLLLDINVSYINISTIGQYTFVDNRGDVYRSYNPHDDKLINEFGLRPELGRGVYNVPGLKNIIQAHYTSCDYITSYNSFGHIELHIFLDNTGAIYFLVLKSTMVRELIKGPYKLPNFNNIVKIYAGWGAYGFITMYGQAYVYMESHTSMKSHISLECLINGIENPKLITLPPNMLAKDIVINEDSVYLLLQ